MSADQLNPAGELERMAREEIHGTWNDAVELCAKAVEMHLAVDAIAARGLQPPDCPPKELVAYSDDLVRMIAANVRKLKLA